MFLHSGAGLHGHEYSPVTTPRVSPKTRTSPLPSPHNTTMDSPEPSPPVVAFAPAAPVRPTSLLLPGISYISSFVPSAKTFWETPASGYFPSQYLPSRFRVAEESGSSSLRTSFDHASVASPPEVDESDVESETCDTTTCSSSRCGKAKRSKTRFLLARPIPGAATKQRRRQPRLLLQMRRVDQKGQRPTPAVEVAPSSDIAGARPKLDSGDLLVLRSDHDKDDSWLGPGRPGDDSSREQDIMAVMSPRGATNSGNAEIVMDDGSVWVASRRTTGSYDFCHTNENGNSIVGRWVRRHGRGGNSADERFSFCIMDPLRKRHPFLGSLKPDGLDVYETYTPSAGPVRPARPVSYAADGSMPLSASVRASRPELVSEEHKRLMTVTGIWVSLSQDNWPGTLPQTTARCPVPKKSASCSHRTSTYDDETLPHGPPTSPLSEACGNWPADVRSPGGGARAQRRISSGAAYMERRRAAAAAAATAAAKDSLPITTPEDGAKEKCEVKAQPRRGKMREWAHRLVHLGSRKKDREAAMKDTRASVSISASASSEL